MILKDPKVLSAVSLKKRGEKGWRELQGEALRDHLLELNRKEVLAISFCLVWFSLHFSPRFQSEPL